MQQYKEYFSDKDFIISFCSGFALLIASLVAQFYVNGYVTRSMSESVTDIVLSNTRVYAVDGVFIYGALLLVGFALLVGFKHLNYMPFALKSVALFVLIRSIFISLTHISPFPTHVVISSAFFTKEFFTGIFNGNDLFFSGHTGLPFLFALMCWKNKAERYIFLAFSLLFGVIVLLGHLHYSIDVLSAFFITYTIFHMAEFLFKKERALFLK